jgi:Zn-dependent protease with chaperone function
VSGAGLIQLAVLALAAFAALLAGLVAVAYPRVGARVERLPAGARADVLAALAAAPMLGSVALRGLCFLPSLVGAVWPGFDHCPHHHAGHPHFCVVHLPDGAGSVAGWAIAAGVVIAVIAALSPHVRRLARSRRILSQVVATADYDRSRGIWVAAVDQPIALTTGIRTPRVLASRGLLGALEPELLTAVLAHEEAHASRRDGLRRALAGLMSIAHAPQTRGRLLRDLDLAIEQACDDQAGHVVGDRLTVARALIAVRKLGQTRPCAAALTTLSIGGSSLDARVEALLGEPVAASPRAGRALLAAAVVVAALAADPLHHLAETALGLLTR